MRHLPSGQLVGELRNPYTRERASRGEKKGKLQPLTVGVLGAVGVESTVLFNEGCYWLISF